jgi:hypothetical protein
MSFANCTHCQDLVRVPLMKQLIFSIIFLTMSLSAQAQPEFEAFDQTQIAGSPEDVEGVPSSLLCNGVALSQADSLEPIFQRDFAQGPESELVVSVRVNEDRSQILFDSIDGDQIDSLLFSKSDLLALAAGELNAVIGHKYTGFWWRDGKELEISAVTCSLVSSK